jgi:hypothetical protein
MDSLCPVVEGGTETARDHLTLGAILPVLPPLLKLDNHKLRCFGCIVATLGDELRVLSRDRRCLHHTANRDK